MPTIEDYNAIAKIVARSYQRKGLAPVAQMIRQIAAAEIAEELAQYFAEQNPQFDRQRFLLGCQLNRETLREPT